MFDCHLKRFPQLFTLYMLGAYPTENTDSIVIVQQYLNCCMLIRCGRNVFTEMLPISERLLCSCHNINTWHTISWQTTLHSAKCNILTQSKMLRISYHQTIHYMWSRLRSLLLRPWTGGLLEASFTLCALENFYEAIQSIIRRLNFRSL
jgi:hypothetical protein